MERIKRFQTKHVNRSAYGCGIMNNSRQRAVAGRVIRLFTSFGAVVVVATGVRHLAAIDALRCCSRSLEQKVS